MASQLLVCFVLSLDINVALDLYKGFNKVISLEDLK